jgi:hypothetical protein
LQFGIHVVGSFARLRRAANQVTGRKIGRLLPFSTIYLCGLERENLALNAFRGGAT